MILVKNFVANRRFPRVSFVVISLIVLPWLLWGPQGPLQLTHLLLRWRENPEAKWRLVEQRDHITVESLADDGIVWFRMAATFLHVTPQHFRGNLVYGGGASLYLEYQHGSIWLAKALILSWMLLILGQVSLLYVVSSPVTSSLVRDVAYRVFGSYGEDTMRDFWKQRYGMGFSAMSFALWALIITGRPASHTYLRVRLFVLFWGLGRYVEYEAEKQDTEATVSSPESTLDDTHQQQQNGDRSASAEGNDSMLTGDPPSQTRMAIHWGHWMGLCVGIVVYLVLSRWHGRTLKKDTKKDHRLVPPDIPTRPQGTRNNEEEVRQARLRALGALSSSTSPPKKDD